MAGEVQHALDIGAKIIKIYEYSTRRLWHPKLSLAWLGLPHRTLVFEDDEACDDDDLGEIQDKSQMFDLWSLCVSLS